MISRELKSVTLSILCFLRKEWGLFSFFHQTECLLSFTELKFPLFTHVIYLSPLNYFITLIIQAHHYAHFLPLNLPHLLYLVLVLMGKIPISEIKKFSLLCRRFTTIIFVLSFWNRQYISVINKVMDKDRLQVHGWHISFMQCWP